MKRLRAAGCAVLLFVGAVAVSVPVRAAASPVAATLGRGIPSSAVLYFHWRRGEVELPLGAARAVKLWPDLALLALEGARPRAGDAGASWKRILRDVDWAALLAREVAAGFVNEGARRDALFLFRVKRGLEGVLEGLRRLTYAVCSLSPELEIAESWQGREKELVLYDLSRGEVLALASRGDVVLMATSSQLLARSIQLLQGESSDLSYADTAARAAALRRISGRGRPGRTFPFELHVQVRRMFSDLPVLSDVDSFVMAGAAGARRLEYRFEVRFAPGAESELEADPAPRSALSKGKGLVRRLCLEGRGLGSWWRRIPEGVRSYGVFRGVDPEVLQVFLGRLLAEGGGDARLPARWGLPTRFGQKREGLFCDVLSLLSAPKTVLAGETGVAVLCDLRGGEAARERLSRVLAAAADWLRSHGLAPRPVRIEDLDGTFQAVEWTSPQDNARGGSTTRRLLVGTAGGMLVLSSSEPLVKRAFRDAGGKPGGEPGRDARTDFPPSVTKPGKGELLAIQRAGPPLGASVGRLVFSFVQSVSLRRWLLEQNLLKGLQPAGKGGSSAPSGARLRATAVLSVFSGLSAALDAFRRVRLGTHYALREGDSVRGGGFFSFGGGESAERERRF